MEHTHKAVLKAVLVIFGSIYIGFILQTSIFNHLEMGGIIPNLLLVVTVVFGYLKGRKAGILIGFMCGLLLDIFIGSYFGMNALILMYIGYLNGTVRIFYFGDDIKFPLLIIAVSDLFYGCVVYAVLFLMRERSDFYFYLEHVIIPEAVYTVIVGIVVYYVIYLALSWADKHEKRATREIV